MPRFFTLAQAREHLPRVRFLIEQAVDGKAKYFASERWSQDFIRRVMVLGGMLVDRAPFEKNRETQNNSAERLKAAVEEIHSLGILVKDLDTGLIDFPTLLNGQEVYLCWQMGEEDLQFWHGIQEGFGGRKPIDEDFQNNHSGRGSD